MRPLIAANFGTPGTVEYVLAKAGLYQVTPESGFKPQPTEALRGMFPRGVVAPQEELLPLLGQIVDFSDRLGAVKPRGRAEPDHRRAEEGRRHTRTWRNQPAPYGYPAGDAGGGAGRGEAAARAPIMSTGYLVVGRLRELSLTDNGLVRLRLLVKLYARPVADALAAGDGAVR